MNETIRYRMPPLVLPRVKEKYYQGVFGEFGDVVRARIAELRGSTSAINEEKARFFEYLLTQIDAEKFGRLQESFLSPPVIDHGCIKYFDPITWFESKLALARRLGLHKR